jgi:hypothetical protein
LEACASNVLNKDCSNPRSDIAPIKNRVIYVESFGRIGKGKRLAAITNPRTKLFDGISCNKDRDGLRGKAVAGIVVFHLSAAIAANGGWQNLIHKMLSKGGALKQKTRSRRV